MRIVIDLQAAQAENRNRGIGRYALSMAQAMVRNRGEHEVVIALNGHFTDTIESIRSGFLDFLPQENVRVWHAVAPVEHCDANNDWRREAAERVREAFLASLTPDFIFIPSLFEGLADNAVVSIGEFSTSVPVAVMLYDLIPYIHRRPYLENPVVEDWYLAKITHLRRAEIWLAVSESSKNEGISYLNLPASRVINTLADVDTIFKPLSIQPELEYMLRKKYGLHHPFVMYTGGIDHRKNIEGLIRAYAKLPAPLRQAYQLAIVCSVHPEGRQALDQLAEQHGLSKDEVILTGFVSDDDLVALYNLCKLFIFPSWHEGFGLPALEAMRCGAPVISANTSSLPEVIGWDEALFDPHSDEAIAAAMQRALTDTCYREALISHGNLQAKRFSWNESARRAISAMEKLHAERRETGVKPFPVQRPKLAYVSPLPPERSGIADYSAELLPELARHYEIEVVVAQDKITDPWINQNCPCRSVQWFTEHADQYDRVLYHFGNSTFHQHMFALLKTIPGVVVLHDFYLSGIVAHLEVHGHSPGHWLNELYHSHGYAALRDRMHAKDVAQVIWQYPCSLSVIQGSLGMIVHSQNSLRLAVQWYGGDTEDWSVIPLLRNAQVSLDKTQARRALGLSDDALILCTFGILGPSKLNHRLLQAWAASSLAYDANCYLVFVGENHPGDYGRELLQLIQKCGLPNNIRITGWADAETFRNYLTAADIGVQLRALSRGETSGTVLDCMNYGLATIVNANGSMADLPDEAVWKLPDDFADTQLIAALEALRHDPIKRAKLGQAARGVILRDHDPTACAEQYRNAIERCYQFASTTLPALPAAIAAIGGLPADQDLVALAGALNTNFPPGNRQKQLLVDISELVHRDARTGIQRVVRNILREWLNNPPAGFRVEPVYATLDDGYRYARRFTLGFMDCPVDVLPDEPIDYAPGDIFLGLDLQPRVAPAQRAFIQAMRHHGVQVKFVVYDLLCVLMPQYFVPGAAETFNQWLETIIESDGAVCISEAVAGELDNWIKENRPAGPRQFKIDWFHLGADLDTTNHTRGLPTDASTTLDSLRARPTFLMVGTLEPRKGHAQVLDAFGQLWKSGNAINLVIVGKQGWLVDDLVARLRAHPGLNKRLFWFEGISDEYLEKIYAASTCLIAASYGEGFGLPLIEAAQHKLPIIARDIPVFREVAGEHAYYFDATSPEELCRSVKSWLDLYRRDAHPKSDAMPWLKWRESASVLLGNLIGSDQAKL